ncbi:2-oxoglutarate ferredoxin oxidoreductase subunit gamma [Clostridiales bacterium PH28_bin88]|nr:2-oxoglutarate ferredoxin oxidoreductase subunit gamma [Clostridiales bacterium PH28_bin88]
MKQFNELRLSGSGGQGLILAGIILAEAAIKEGKNAVQTQSYGPEARGGASKAEVIISSEEIDYPKVSKPDVLLAMTQEACDKYRRDLRPDSLLLADATHVHDIPAGSTRVYSLPITRVAREELGKEMVANIVALGALAQLTGVVSRESLVSAILARVPKGTENLNERAFQAGWSLAQAAKQRISA